MPTVITGFQYNTRSPSQSKNAREKQEKKEEGWQEGEKRDKAILYTNDL